MFNHSVASKHLKQLFTTSTYLPSWRDPERRQFPKTAVGVDAEEHTQACKEKTLLM